MWPLPRLYRYLDCKRSVDLQKPWLKFLSIRRLSKMLVKLICWILWTLTFIVIYWTLIKRLTISEVLAGYQREKSAVLSGSFIISFVMLELSTYLFDSTNGHTHGTCYRYCFIRYHKTKLLKTSRIALLGSHAFPKVRQQAQVLC